MLLDMRQYPQNALLIIIPSCFMLWPVAAHLQAKLANALTGRLTILAVLQVRYFSTTDEHGVQLQNGADGTNSKNGLEQKVTVEMERRSMVHKNMLFVRPIFVLRSHAVIVHPAKLVTSGG